MDVKRLLEPLLANVRKKIIGSSFQLGRAVDRAPRPLRRFKEKDLNRYLGIAIGHVGISAISLRTGKALVFTVKDRQLNKLGQVEAVVSLVSNGALLVLVAHEVWARKRENYNKSLNDMVDEIVSNFVRKNYGQK